MDSSLSRKGRSPEDAGGTIPYDISTSDSTDKDMIESITSSSYSPPDSPPIDPRWRSEIFQIFRRSEIFRRSASDPAGDVSPEIFRRSASDPAGDVSPASPPVDPRWSRVDSDCSPPAGPVSPVEAVRTDLLPLDPDLISLMRGTYIPQHILNKLLSTDLVPSHDGRILVVGSFGAGKTTLVMNLIYDKIPNERQSTIGIDVYFGNLLFDVKNRRFLRRRAGQHSFSKALYQKLLAYLGTVDLIQGKRESGKNQWKIRPATIKNIQKKVNMFAESADAHNEEFIPIPILDFAGQIVYLATHQTFITSHGIYAVTFNGAKDLHSTLKEDFNTVNENYTILDGIRQWVSSILTYCFPETKGYPKILFVATHRDLLEDEQVEDKREEFLRILRSTLTEENKKSHLMLDTLFFINATDPEDAEITNLRNVLEKLICENPHWDRKVPRQFLVLEMMLAALVEEGKLIMSRTEIDEMNRQTGDKPLSEEELDFFLHIQHNCGKLTYLNVPGLKDNVVINPVCLVDVLKSVVTSTPTLPDLKEGRLRKSDLATLWKSGNFIQFLPFEDYLRELLVHYDILAEVRRYDKESGKRGDVDVYLVPCMAPRHNKTSFVRNCLTRDKCISFVFEFKTSVVPSAIPSRMIACLISMWNVKAYENTELLFSGFAGVTVDRKHDLVLQTEGNMLVLILIHKERKQLIVRDLASSVRECLEQNLIRISEVYSLSFSTDLMSKRYVPFELKVRSGCFNSSCLLDPNDLPQLDQTWKCAHHGVETPSSELDIWYTDRGFQECTTSCHGIVDAVLSMLLNDTHLLRICSFLTVEEVRSLAVHLGMSKPELDEVEQNKHMASMLKFYSLRACREKNKSCADFVKAMEQAEINKHTMCKILRQQEIQTDLPDNLLKHSPSDEMLDKICLRIGKEWTVLGLELGLEIERLEQIEYDSPRVLREVSRNMLYCWRNRDNEATIRELLQALGRCGRNPGLIREILENCDSFPNLKPED